MRCPTNSAVSRLAAELEEDGGLVKRLQSGGKVPVKHGAPKIRTRNRHDENGTFTPSQHLLGDGVSETIP